LQQIRKFNEQCAIVVITGTGGIQTATLAVNHGADGYIDKQNLTLGNDPADFFFALEQALERRAGLVAQRELQEFKADFYSMVTHDLRNPASSIALSKEIIHAHNCTVEAQSAGHGTTFIITLPLSTPNP
jgi:signal transduction histidine kinase